MIMDTCMVPEVIQKLQTLVDEQQIRLEEISGDASDLLNQAKNLRSHIFSLKNAIYNAQQGLKDVADQRNSMCDFHYTKAKKSKAGRPWEDQLNLDSALKNFMDENNYEDNINFIPQKTQNEGKEDRPFKCKEDGCTSTYKKKKELNRHVKDKHSAEKNTNDRNGDTEENTRSVDFNNNVKSETQPQSTEGETNSDLADYTGHVDPDYSYTDINNNKKGKSKSYTDKEYACDECEYVSTGRLDRLKRHKETVHSDLKPFTCHQCDFASKRKDKLKLHLEKKH